MAISGRTGNVTCSNSDLAASCCGAAAPKASPGEKLSSASETEEECGRESNNYRQGNRLFASLRCTPFLIRPSVRTGAPSPRGKAFRCEPNCSINRNLCICVTLKEPCAYGCTRLFWDLHYLERELPAVSDPSPVSPSRLAASSRILYFRILPAAFMGKASVNSI